MSGIAGYWSYAASDIASAAFAAFNDSLAHRGPDGCGIDHFPDVRLWLGHRHPAILDRADDASQPMADAERRYWLSYDGEIYNDCALRDELRRLGRRFVSDSPGEVILAAYAQWGENCLARFNGMWAFAIWDSRERELFLARDAFGIKPLHYARQGGVVAFASELKAFLRLPWIDGAFDPEILAATLSNVDEQEASPLTLLPGVHRLPAGHALTIDAFGGVRVRAWWKALDQVAHPADRLDDQADEFRSLLLDACKSCLQTDVPLAIEQSGGLDSSAIACCVGALDRRDTGDGTTKDRRRAFIACFADARYDEYGNARMVADHLGMTLDRIDIDDRRALEVIEQVIFDHENVFGFPRVGAWMLYRAMRDAGIRVSLSGIGSDDVFGSDTDCVEAALDVALKGLDLRRYRQMRRVLRGMRGGNVDIGRATASGEMGWHLRRALAKLRLLQPLRAISGRRSGEPLLRPTGRRHSGDDGSVPAGAGAAALAAKRHADFRRITPLYLANFDRASSAHGIEVRMPFMDPRIVAYGLALPEQSLNGGGHTKRVMRLAMTGMMPDPVRLRTSKTAFTVPLDRWARGALKPWLLDLCASRDFLDSDLWNGAAVRRIVERTVAGDGSLHRVWPILQSYVLQRAFIARASEEFATASEPEMIVP